MRDSRLVQLFERYRSHGDVEALAKVFDEVAPGLVKVARHLDGRTSEAEDLVQATFLVAIERASTFDAARPLAPWLMGILINQSRIARRRRGRTVDVEVADPASAAGQEADLEGSEFETAVTKALSDLPEMYREVLIPHLREGKKPREIADQLGRPHGTVRAQIHRGLRLLRKLLPAGFAAGGAAVATSSEGLAAVREAVLARARAAPLSSAPLTIAPLSTATRVARRGLSSSRLALLGLVALFMAVTWFAIEWISGPSRSRDDAGPSMAESSGTQRDEDGDPYVSGGARVSIAPLAGENAALAPPEPYGEVLVRVLHRSDLTPAAGVPVTLFAWGGERWYADAREKITAEDGTVHFVHVHAGRIGVHLDRGTQTRADVLAGQQTTLELQLRFGIGVTGVVLDRTGAAVEGARVEVFTCDGEVSARSSAVSARDGTFDLNTVEPQMCVGARALGYAPSQLVWLGVRGIADVDNLHATLVLGDSGRPLSGRVVDPIGQPISGASITAGRPRSAGVRWRGDGVALADAAPARAISGADGRFEIEELSEGALEVGVEAGGWPAWRGILRAVGSQETHIEVRLSRGATIHGVVRGPQGGAFDGALLAMRSGRGAQPLTTLSDVRGEFRIPSIPPGEFEIQASAGEFAAPVSMRFHAAAGGELRWDPVVEREQVITGTAVGLDGRPLVASLVKVISTALRAGDGDLSPLQRWVRGLWGSDRRREMLQCWTDERGRFNVPCSGAGPFTLELRRRADWRGTPASVVDDVAGGTRNVVLRIGQRSCWVIGSMRDEQGRPLAACEITAVPHACSGEARARCDPIRAAFKLGALVPGRYDLVAWPQGAPPRLLDTIDLAAGKTAELGERRIEPPGALRAIVRARDGLALGELSVHLTSAQAWEYEVTRGIGGELVASGLPPGRYTLSLEGSSGLVIRREFEIRARQTAQLAIDLDE